MQPGRIVDKEGGGSEASWRHATVVRRGRVKGLTSWLISQRPAALPKAVLSQIDGLVAFRLTASSASYRGPPMTLGNMRANGVQPLDVCCWLCHHRTILSADPWPDHVPVPSFGPRMVCTRCGIVGADARPNWREQSPRERV
jgi:hypothetical protein